MQKKRMTAGPTAMMLTAALALAAAASAQVGQRLYGKVLDANGQPVEGAEVTIETRALGTKQRVHVKSDKKGRYRAVFLHPARDYVFQIRKDGFLPLDELVELGLQRNDVNIPITRDFHLQPGHAAPDPGNSPALPLYNEAVEAIQAGDLATARSRLEKAVETDPELALAYTVLAQVCRDLEDPKAAAGAAEKALELDPEDVSALRIHYGVLKALGRTEDARRSLDALAEKDPGEDTAKRLFNAGAEALAADDWSQAETRFRQALDMDPALMTAHEGLARAYLSEKKFRVALEEAEQLLDLDPHNHTALLVRLRAYEALGEEEKAVQAKAELDAGGRSM